MRVSVSDLPKLRRKILYFEISVIIPEVLDDPIEDVWEKGGSVYVCYKIKGEGAIEDGERLAESLRKEGYHAYVNYDSSSSDKAFVNVKLKGNEIVEVIEEDFEIKKGFLDLFGI